MSPRTTSEVGKLLVIDDNKVNRLLLGRGLEQQGHHVAFAESGQKGLELLRDHEYDLILLDIQMPEMDGYQVLEKIMADLELRNVPVVMTSAVEELESVAKCIEMGAEDYLVKPINPVLLRARINNSLEKKRLRDQQRELIRKFATSAVADDLMEKGFTLGGRMVNASAMFSDIRGFTTIAESQTPADTIELLNTYYTLMFEAIGARKGVVNQMVGDGLMAIFGAPVEQDDHCDQAVRAALEMTEMIDLFNLDQAAQGKVTIRIGIGIASGNVVAGYTGTQSRATYTCVGDTVNLAARLEAHTKVVGQPILIDQTTRDQLGSDLEPIDQGLVELKGKVNQVRIYSIPTGQAVLS